MENGTTNEKWKVSFGIPHKVVSWLQGWKRVAVGNEIRPGDVMVFILEGHSHFVFHLFDEHGQPKLQNSIGVQSHDPTVKEEPTSSSQQADGDPLELDFCSLKKRRLFDPDIVKLETEIIDETSEGGEAIATENPHEDSHDPASDNLYENSIPTAGRLEIGTEVAPLPDSSDLEVTVAVPGIVPGMVEGTVDISGGKAPWSEGSDHPLEVPEEAGKLQHDGTKMKSVKQVMDVIVRRPPLVQPDSPIDPLAFFITSRRREITHVEKKRPRELAKAHAELLLGYHFVLALSAAQVYRDFHVTLPARFVSDARLSPDVTRMKVVDLHGKEWKMYCRMTSSGTVAFHRKHWGVFSLEHLLEEGDACLFQLKSKGALTMSVRIFRVLQLPKALGRGRFSVCEHYDMRAKSNQCRSEVNR